jgi:hypothetical protein
MSGRIAACMAGLVFAVVVTTAAAGRAPAGPTNLRITASSATSISLAWDPVSSKASTKWWYCVQKSGQGCFRVDPPRTSFTMTRLMPATTTHWSVITVDSMGHRSAPSNVVTYTTPPDTTPPSPAPTLSVTYLQPTRIAVSWTGSTDDTSQVWHTLFKDGVATNGVPIFIGLTPSTSYTFKVTARDASGNTAESNVVTVTTPPKRDDLAPTAPTNLRLAPASEAPEAWLEWDQSADDTDPQSQILYEVYVNGRFADESWDIGRGETLTYCRDFGTLNSIVLHAVDTSGNRSGPSNTIFFQC